MGMRRLGTLLGVMATSLSLAGCFLVPPGAFGTSSEETVRIGVIAPASGTNAEKGESVYNGAQLAIEQINAAGGVLGKKLSLLKADDQSDNVKAIPKAAKLLDQGVVALIGNVQSSVTKAVLLAEAKPRGCVMVSPGSTSPDFSDPAKIDHQGWFFRTVPTDALQGKAIAKRAFEAGYKKLGILNVDNTYGNGLAGVLKQSFEANPGCTIVKVTYPDEATPRSSYNDVINPLLAEKPDAIALIAYPGAGSQIVNDWITSGTEPLMPWLFSEALKADSFVVNVKDAERIEGKTGTAPYSGGANYDRFALDYQARFKIPPGPYSVNAYDAAMLIALAMQKGQAVTRDSVKANLQAVSAGTGTLVKPGVEGIKSALAMLQAGQSVNYDGASGPVDLDARGDVTSGTYVVWKVQGKAIHLTPEVLTP